MKRIATFLPALSIAVFAVVAAAKLPPPSDEAKAKAAEAAAKGAHANKVGAYQLCKVQDKVAAEYLAQAKKSGKKTAPVPTPACTDPGPFVAAAGDPKQPLEGSGAHSPPKPASGAPSSPATQAEKPKK